MKLSTTTSVCRVLADKYGATVRMIGAKAFTDGKTYTIPDLGKMDDKKITILRGYLDHEAGAHGRYTDFPAIKAMVKNKRHMEMTNLLEDIRVEALLGNVYPGCKANLTALNNSLIEDGKMGEEGNTTPTLALLISGLKIVAGQDISVIKGLDMTAKSAFGSDVFSRIAAMKSTEDAINLAASLIEVLEDKAKEESKEDEPEDSKDEAKKALEDLDNMKDKSEIMAESLERMHAEAIDDGEYMVFSKDGDAIEFADQADDDDEYKNLHERLGTLNVLKGKVARLFQSTHTSKWIGDRDRGKINNRALAKIATGNRRVFKEKYATQQVNTAASFLVDFSGSMSHDKMRAAMMSVVLFLETLEPIGVKTEVLGYTTDGYCKGIEEGFHKYGRIENLKTVIFKTFNEGKTMAVKKRISGWSRIHRSQNCDPCSVMIAAERLMQRPEKRKILFVLTDGEVANNGNIDAGRRELKRLVKEIEQSGQMEIIGVDLMSGEAKYTYSNCINVTKSSDLAAKMFEGLKTILL